MIGSMKRPSPTIAPIIRAAGGVVDSHLIVVEPEKHFGQIAKAGGESVTFHVKAVGRRG